MLEGSPEGSDAEVTESNWFHMFEGPSGHLVPMHNYDYLSGGLFFMVRKMILYAVLNKCKGMAGLSPAIVAYIVSGIRVAAVEHIVLENIPDPVMQYQLKQVFTCIVGLETRLFNYACPSSLLQLGLS